MQVCQYVYMVGRCIWLCGGRRNVPSWEREADIDDEYCNEGEEDIESEVSEAYAGVPRPDLPVTVAIPEQDMLLQH